MIWRILALVLGAVSIWTGLYAAANFNPPLGADPGGVNVCWMTFAVLIIGGCWLMHASTWRLVK